MKKLMLFAIAIVFILVSSTDVYCEEKAHPAETSPMALTKPKAQFFCGYCHILTYPRVIEKAFNSWKADKHSAKEIGCKVCHYPPETLSYTILEHRNIPKDEKADSKKKTVKEFMKTELEVLSRLITVVNMGEAVVRTSPRIDDRSCTTSECHGSEKDEFMTKKIKLSDKELPFIHENHYDREKWVEGQEMHCTTCHQHETGQNHFEVSRDKCFLCHFKNLALNEERSKCSLCHEIPTKPLQTQKKEDKPDETPITHKSLEEKKVACESCHLQLKRGKGEVREKNCLDCHDNEEKVMKELFNKKLMHEKHVAAQTAHCFNCHEPVEHKETDFIDIAIEQCTACHPDHHAQQKMLIAGTGGKGSDQDYPISHFNMKVNCFACHTRDDYDYKGVQVMKGNPENCATCHTEDEKKLVKKWTEDVYDILEETAEIEQEAIVAIEVAKGKLPAARVKKAMAMVAEGRENIKIVIAGGGVHNKKYSVLLLDIAMEKFENAIEEINQHF
jgi:hypothetical protein